MNAILSNLRKIFFGKPKYTCQTITVHGTKEIVAVRLNK